MSERQRQRIWACPTCGATLGTITNPHGGYARLWPHLPALDRIAVEGHEVRLTCARCQETRVWVTQEQQAA